MAEFARMLLDLRAMLEQNDLLAVFDEIVTRTGYNLYVHEISDTPEQVADRLENIGQLRSVVTESRDQTLGDFLSETALVAEVDSLIEDEDKVTLLTLHAAKGLEYPVVFITGLEEGLLPHSRSFDDPDGMQEERRLLYVGLTRAKDQVYLTYAFRRMLYGDSIPGVPSRFLADIPENLTDGVSATMGDLRSRAAYQRQTSWPSPSNDTGRSSGGFGGFSSGGSSSDRPSGFGSLGSRGNKTVETTPSGRKKIIPFRSEPKAAPETKYRTGMKVSHAKFGVGTVIESKVYGGDEEVTVAFTGGAGMKKLAASFANLVILK